MDKTIAPCATCGGALPSPAATGARRKYCDSCRRARKAKNSVAFRSRRRAELPEPPPRPCKTCDSPFRSTDRRKLYCSKACGSRSWDAEKIRTTYKRVCSQCSEQFETRVRTQEFCSQGCAGLASAGVAEKRNCLVCSEIFDSYGRATCSPACYRWNKKYPGRPLPARCGQCFQSFKPRKLGQIYCARRCVRLATQSRRRCRKAALPFEPVVPAAIFERDGWTCRICDDPIDPVLRNYHPMMPTLDHVVPVCSPDYPGHYADNLAAAHLVCNNRKRHRSLAEIRAIIAHERLAALAA